MNKEEAIEWAKHFPTNKNLWYVVVPHNNGYVVYSSNHSKWYPMKEIVYSTKNKNDEHRKISN